MSNMTIPIAILMQEIECADVDELADILLKAGEELCNRMQEEQERCISGMRLKGTNTKTHKEYTIDIMQH